jgi:hypothetical protein
LLPNRYALKISDSLVMKKPGVKLAKEAQYANTLRTFMIEQSANRSALYGVNLAGKTGTPERIWKQEKINDGWYVFFSPNATGTGNTVVCIRVESTKGSSDAVKLAGQHVIPILLEKGYIKSNKKVTYVQSVQ